MYAAVEKYVVFFDTVLDHTDSVHFAADDYDGKGDDISVQLPCIG